MRFLLIKCLGYLAEEPRAVDGQPLVKALNRRRGRDFGAATGADKSVLNMCFITE